jgi:hypothetical protein
MGAEPKTKRLCGKLDKSGVAISSRRRDLAEPLLENGTSLQVEFDWFAFVSEQM